MRSCFISSGLMTMRALEAAKALEADRIDVGVLHVPTIKPLDTQTILAACSKPGGSWWSRRTTPSSAASARRVAGLLMREGVHPAFA